MLRLGLIGCGRHSQTDHARPLKRYASEHPDEISLEAVCDLKPDLTEFFRREFGFKRVYTDYRAMLDAEKLDGCVSVVPVPVIAATAEELFRRRIPCVIEKPPGASLHEASRLATLALETGASHMVSVNRRFNPLLNKAVAWARENGGIRHLRGTMMRSERKEEDFTWGTGIHAVDAFRHIAGEVREWNARRLSPPSSPAWSEVSFAFEGGCRGHLDIMPTAGLGQETYELIGDEFVARVSIPFHMETSLRCWKAGKLALEQVMTERHAPEIMSGAYAETTEFIAALKSGTRPSPTIHDILPSAEICDGIAKAQH